MNSQLQRGLFAIALAFIALSGSALYAQPQAPVNRVLAINEVYFGTTSQDDQFIEIYNPGTTTQFLDGMILARFGATGGSGTTGALTGVADAWKFPGIRGDHNIPISAGSFVVVAASAKRVTGGLDLTTANFETFAGRNSGDADNTSVPNLIKLSNVTATGDLKMTIAHDAIVLALGTDTSMKNGLNISSFVDCVQFTSANQTGLLPANLDAGIALGARLGSSIERKTKGVSTANSSLDFELAAPTPGTQHGGSTGGGGKVRGIDIMPLDKGRWVEYDYYSTDDAGLIQPSTKAFASNRIVADGMSFGGSAGVSVALDSANVTRIQGTESATDLHYKADVKFDVQVFADTNFFKLFVPAGFVSSITAPNTFVDYIKLSAGENKQYPVLSLNQQVAVPGSPIPATLVMTSNGKFEGIQKISVPKGSFDSAYTFAVTSHTKVSISFPPFIDTTLMDVTVTSRSWHVRGIGIVKTNVPSVSTGIVPLPGSERQMTAFGAKGISSVHPILDANAGVKIYPNPFDDLTVINFPRNEQFVTAVVCDLKGSIVQKLDCSDGMNTVVVYRNQLPNGVYLVNLQTREGDRPKQRALRIVIEP